MCKILLFLNFYSSTWLDLPSGPNVKCLGGVKVHFIVGICDLSWPLMASKTEKYHVLVIFLQVFFSIFGKFNLSNGLYIAPGPQKGIL